MVLFLNDIAGSEVLLILVFILIFFGSKSIPGIARTMGRTMRQIKDATQEVQEEIRKSSQEMKGEMNFKSIIQDTMNDLENDIQQPLDQYTTDIEEAIHYQAPKKTIEPIIEDASAKMNVSSENTKENLTQAANPSDIPANEKSEDETKNII